MLSDRTSTWRVVYIAQNERQAVQIEAMLQEGGFLVDRQYADRSNVRHEDIEIRVLDAEAEEARFFLFEQGL